MWAEMAQSVQRLATGWLVRGLNAGGVRFSAPIQTGSGAKTSLLYNGCWFSFPGVKQVGRCVNHPS
jgi:hypothetical protein